jgi:hypothetical protein
MAHTIQMTVNTSVKDSNLIFRILNFKEDMHRELLQGEYGTVAEPASMDNAFAPVTITIPRKRHYDHIVSFMAGALGKHAVGHAVHLRTEHS